MSSFFPISGSSETSNAVVPVVITFNNIPQNTRIRGALAEFESPSLQISGDLYQYYRGNFENFYVIKQGETTVRFGKFKTPTTWTSATVTNTSAVAVGDIFDILPIISSQPYYVSLWPGSITYKAGSFQLLTERN